MDKSRLGHSTVLYRGLSLPDGLAQEFAQPGAVIEGRFYRSTSSKPLSAVPHGAGPSPLSGEVRPPRPPNIVLKILAPKGTRFMPGIKDEYILAPTTTMTVRRIEQGPSGETILVVDLEDA